MHIIALILLLVLNPALSPQKTFDTISLKFERKVVQDDSTEVVKGIAYYKAPHRIFIRVQTPVDQIMIVDQNVLTIYYPIEKKAFRIKGKGPIPMPFIQSILSAMKNDYGLAEMGYILTKHNKKEDILYTHWEPSKEHKKRMGKFVIGTKDGIMVYAEAKSPDGKSIAKSFYQKHIEFNGRHFPVEMRSEIREGSKRIEEFVTYDEVKFNISLPDEVLSFKIPDSIPIKEIEW